MSVDSWTDDLASVVRYALTTTRATAICPFYDSVTIRVGDDAAETHVYVRATKVIKSDGTTWEHEALHREIDRQLDEAADGVCPGCAPALSRPLLENSIVAEFRTGKSTVRSGYP
jgi:hypothetical protein